MVPFKRETDSVSRFFLPKQKSPFDRSRYGLFSPVREQSATGSILDLVADMFDVLTEALGGPARIQAERGGTKEETQRPCRESELRPAIHAAWGGAEEKDRIHNAFSIRRERTKSQSRHKNLITNKIA